jgi:hypothetical protein
MSDPIQSRPDTSPVPVSYAEKTMASLLQLHSELMEEKERRVDLYRRLSEKDEALAELRYQVKLLEDRLRRAEGLPPEPVKSPPKEATVSQAAVAPPAPPSPAPAVATPVAAAPAAVRASPRAGAASKPVRPAAKREDWRQW